MSRDVRNCPTCRKWWHDRMRYGCVIDPKRVTNTTLRLGSEYAAGPCEDYTPIENTDKTKKD